MFLNFSYLCAAVMFCYAYFFFISYFLFFLHLNAYKVAGF